jgi:predicted dehydrogenase
MTNKVRIGVIGTSGWADMMYFPSFKSHPFADVVAICGRNRELAVQMAAKYDIPTVYTDYRTLIAHDDLDAVVISTPDDLHYPMTMEALDADLHVLCEKPLALNTQQALEMYQKAEEKGVKHMVLFTYRWHPYFRYLKQLVDDGYIGRCYHADFYFLCPFALRDTYLWRYDSQRANGIVSDLGAHLIDFARWYVGDIVKVNAQLDAVTERSGAEITPIIPANDTAGVNLQFANGAQGFLRASGVAAVTEMHVRLCGDTGTLETDWYPFGPQADFQLYGGQKGKAPFAELQIPASYIKGLNKDNLLDTFTKQSAGPRLFVDAILEDRPVSPSFMDGVKVQKVIDAALESNRKGIWIEIT